MVMVAHTHHGIGKQMAQVHQTQMEVSQATVSANTTSGFSIVSYTGTGSAATVGHGLGVTPSMYIVKNRSDNDSWGVYHKSLGATQFLRLQATDASATSSVWWNDTEPTSSVFSVGTAVATNASGENLIAYCFAE
jgi:hypothetical protein